MPVGESHSTSSSSISCRASNLANCSVSWFSSEDVRGMVVGWCRSLSCKSQVFQIHQEHSSDVTGNSVLNCFSRVDHQLCISDPSVKLVRTICCHEFFIEFHSTLQIMYNHYKYNINAQYIPVGQLGLATLGGETRVLLQLLTTNKDITDLSSRSQTKYLAVKKTWPGLRIREGNLGKSK